MTYRTPEAERLYLCPSCGAPERALLRGGPVSCSRCRASSTLPDRTAFAAVSPTILQTPPDDPARLQHLRAQDGRPRQVPPTLQAVLGGTAILPGREQEALTLWQSLRARCGQGDMAASEDLTVLTLMLVQLPGMLQQPQLAEALQESAFDVALLSRHRQELLGGLARRAAGRGDRAPAQRYLGWMAPWPAELEADSELRVSAAVLAVLDREPQRALLLLGPQKDVIPIADSLDALASVLRAHAFEMAGNPAAAAQILRELPDPRLLDLVRSRFPALQLCAHSAQVYGAAMTHEAAGRAAASAGNIGAMIGGILAASGLGMVAIGLVVGIMSGDLGPETFITPAIGMVMFVVGVVTVVRARARGRHAAWLRVNGLPLTARIGGAQPTGTLINDVPVYRFSLQVAGPQGPYGATLDKLVPEHQIAMLLGQEVRVRANPAKLAEIIFEE
jgi:hypothetical protein